MHIIPSAFTISTGVLSVLIPVFYAVLYHKPYSIFKYPILTVSIWNSVALWSHTYLNIGPISSFLPGIFCLLFAKKLEYQLHPPTQHFPICG